MRYELKSIGIWSFIKISFFVNLIFGFMMGIFYAIFIGVFMAPMGMLPMSEYSDIDLDGSFMPILLILLPVMFAFGAAVFQTLVGVVLMMVYNMIVKLTGGIEFDLNRVNTASPAVAGPITAHTTIAPVHPPPPPPASPTQPPDDYLDESGNQA